MVRFCFFLINLGLHISGFSLRAQEIVFLPVPENAAYHAAVDFYQREIDTGAAFFNGKQFTEYGSHIEGHAFFKEDWEEASIFYDSILYTKILLHYDLVADVVVIDHKNLGNPIQLQSEKVDWFLVAGHRFVRLPHVQKTGGITPGFYDLVVNDTTGMLVRRKKFHREEIDRMDRRVRNWFEGQDDFYVYKQKTYYKIKGTNSLFSVLADRKQEVKRFLKKNSLSFSKAPEETLKQAITYYNQLR